MPLADLKAQLDTLQAGLGGLLPELIVSLGLLAVLVGDLAAGRRRPGLAPLLLAGFLILALAAVGGELQAGPRTVAEARPIMLGLLQEDSFGAYFQLLVLGAALVATLAAAALPGPLSEDPPTAEYYYLIAGMMPGLLLMSSTHHLLVIYLATELVSLCSYALAAYRRHQSQAAEAAMKYLIFGAVSSGIMLYGISLLYGLGGGFDLGAAAMQQALLAQPAEAVFVAAVLLLAGLAFKLALVPLHFWTPDIYQGASAPAVMLLATAPKAAGLAILIRVLNQLALPATAAQWWPYLLGAMALASMTLGNLLALQQNDYKRMLAYSSIAHAGYLLAALVPHSGLGYAGAAYYAGVYSLMNLGAFQLGGLIGHQAGTDDIRSWREQIQLSPLLTIALVVFMIALTGLPPTAGFTGKLNLLLPLWSAYQGGAGQLYLVLMIGLILNTVLSLFFYLRVPGLLLLRRDPPQAAQPLRIHLSNAILQGLLAAALLYLGLFHFDALVSYLSNLL